MTKTIKIYSTEPCMQCVATKQMMKFYNIEFEEINTATLPDNEKEQTLNMLREKGFMQFPVVVVGDEEDVWSGMQADRIEKYAQK